MTTTVSTPVDAEIRVFPGMEIRAADEGTELALEGCVVPYGVFAPIAARVEESMAAGVFTKSIREAARALPLLMLHDHHSIPVGKAVEWDDRRDGLHARWLMADTDEARQAHRLADGDYLTGLSVGFQPSKTHDVWEFREPPALDRVTRLNARLLETSLVPVPTWSQAVITHTRSALAGGVTLTPHRDAWAEWLETIRAGV